MTTPMISYFIGGSQDLSKRAILPSFSTGCMHRNPSNMIRLPMVKDLLGCYYNNNQVGYYYSKNQLPICTIVYEEYRLIGKSKYGYIYEYYGEVKIGGE